MALYKCVYYYYYYFVLLVGLCSIHARIVSCQPVVDAHWLFHRIIAKRQPKHRLVWMGSSSVLYKCSQQAGGSILCRLTYRPPLNCLLYNSSLSLPSSVRPFLSLSVCLFSHRLCHCADISSRGRALCSWRSAVDECSDTGLITDAMLAKNQVIFNVAFKFFKTIYSTLIIMCDIKEIIDVNRWMEVRNLE